MREGREWTLTVEVRIAEDILQVAPFNSDHFPDEPPLARGLLPEVNEGGCAQILIRRRARREHEQVVAAQTDVRCTRQVGRRERDTLLLKQIDRLCSQARRETCWVCQGQTDRHMHRDTHDSVPSSVTS